MFPVLSLFSAHYFLSFKPIFLNKASIVELYFSSSPLKDMYLPTFSVHCPSWTSFSFYVERETEDREREGEKEQESQRQRKRKEEREREIEGYIQSMRSRDALAPAARGC